MIVVIPDKPRPHGGRINQNGKKENQHHAKAGGFPKIIPEVYFHYAPDSRPTTNRHARRNTFLNTLHCIYTLELVNNYT